MPILKGSVTLTRFKVDDVPADVFATLSDRLKMFAFTPIDDIAEERSFGWTNFDDLLDIEWKQSVPQKEPYIAFSLRLDTRRIPAAVLSKENKIALSADQEKIKALGKNFVSLERKREIREQVKLRLLARTIPTPAYFEVVWHTESGAIWLGSASPKIQDMFVELFGRTFPEIGAIHMLTPYESALAILGDDEDAIDRLNALEPSDFSGAQDATEVSHGVDDILSEEFLTWVLYLSRTGQNVFTVSTHISAMIEDVDQPLSIHHFNGVRRKVAIVRGEESTFVEVWKGMQEGKKVCGVNLCLNINDSPYSARVAYPDLILRSAKLPKIKRDKEDDDPDGLFLERMYFFETLYAAFDGIFDTFVRLRVSDAWQTEAQAIKDWVLDH